MAVFHPTRGGNRGGQDHFNWDDVKTDKDRENYLGEAPTRYFWLIVTGVFYKTVCCYRTFCDGSGWKVAERQRPGLVVSSHVINNIASYSKHN